MKLLDLFSGIGGFTLGLSRIGFKTVGFCESDLFCQKILKKHFPDIPIFKDVRKLDESNFKETVDLITAGFPCPAFSRAGKQGGFEQDDLFFEIIRIAKFVKPKWIIFENVEGFKRWRKTLHTEVEDLGYEWADCILDARDFGIPQSRRRYFAVCVQRGVLLDPQYLRRVQRNEITSLHGLLANAENSQRRWTPTVRTKDEWRYIAAKGQRSRVTNGVSERMAKLRALGNSVCPQIAEFLGRIITNAT